MTVLDKYMTGQVIYWKKQKEQIKDTDKANHLPFITISREYGCCGFMVATRIIEIINEKYKSEPPWVAYDKKLLEQLMADTGLSESLLETLTGKARNKLTDLIQTTFSSFPSQVAIHKKLTETITMLALQGNVVIVGRGSNMITNKTAGGFHVRLVAPEKYRAEKFAKAKNISKAEAIKFIQERSKQREEYMKEFLKFDLRDPNNYDLILNDSHFSVEQLARLIIEGMIIKGLLIK